MSRNRDLDAALKYHNGTKHSYLSLRAHPHFLDWQNKPLLFKIYPTLEVLRLPRDLRQTGVAALSAIAAGPVKSKRKAIPDLDTLAPVLQSEGRAFPVDTAFLARPDDRPIELQVADALDRLYDEGLKGHTLVFLPGAAEIRACLKGCEAVAARRSRSISSLIVASFSMYESVAGTYASGW